MNKAEYETVIERLQEIVTAVTDNGVGISELFVDEWDAAGIVADARDALIESAAALEALEEAQGKLKRYERFLSELRDMTYRAPELFPTTEVATYAHQLGCEVDRILSKEVL